MLSALRRKRDPFHAMRERTRIVLRFACSAAIGRRFDGPRPTAWIVSARAASPPLTFGSAISLRRSRAAR
ncbi:hypothetical protein AB4084_40530, partial [Lysobacter sp. 2RAB21]